MKAIRLSFIILCAFTSCNEMAKKEEIVKSSVKDSGTLSTVTKYFDYETTSLPIAFRDTVFAKFSNDSLNDMFTIDVPDGPIVKTKTTVRIITKQHNIIYEHVFPTSDLVYGYALDEIKTDSEMSKYVLAIATSFLKEGLYNPMKLPDDSYLVQAKKEDFINYDVFIEAKKKGRVIFHYRLNEESHLFLGYSDILRKAVNIIDCC